MFQIQIVTRNVLLQRTPMAYGSKQNSNCSNCKQEGSLIHTYWECYAVNNQWRELFDWIHTKSGKVLTPSGMKCMLNRYECNCVS